MKKAKIEGMKCAGCAETITNELSKIVSDVHVDVPTSTVTFEGDASLEQLNAALAGTPYKITEFIA